MVEPINQEIPFISIYPKKTPLSGGVQKNGLTNTLSEKGFFAFILIFIIVGAVMAGPKPAKAGILDNLWRIISGSDSALVKDSSAAAISMPLLGSQNISRSGAENAAEDMPPLSVTQDSALVAARNPAGTLPVNESDQIVVYTVAAGDTPGSIAERFNISLNTLLWANNLRDKSSIKIGDTLIILPVSGVKYQVKKGDTIESIAKKFKPRDIGDDFQGFTNDILNYNGLAVNETLGVGSEIIIPDGEVSSVSPSPSSGSGKGTSRFYGLPEFIGYYLRPVLGGRKTQGIHGYNGVDLANSCGQPIFASAPGTVIVSRVSGWNGGYGRYVVISHSNNTQTLYAHMDKIFVDPGQNVGQGATLGITGSTGRSTGCHVHFEIRGARNPF